MALVESDDFFSLQRCSLWFFPVHEPGYLSRALLQGLGFRERLAGAWALGDGPHLDRPIAVTVVARLGSLGALLRERKVAIGGEIDAMGLARRSAIVGELGLRRPAALWYRFAFDGDDGLRYGFVGEQRLSLGGLPAALTVLEGRIQRGDETIGRALLRFDLRSDLWPFLTSFRREP
jgi:hypothetical protein